MKVYFIGAGPGDPELITLKGDRLIREADLVLYAGSLVPREIVARAKPGAQVVDSAPLTLDQTHALLRDTVCRGGLAARVHTGDPSLYGAVLEQIRLLERDNISYEIVPGVTAAFAAAAATAQPLTIPERSQSFIITRLPGRTPVPEKEKFRDLARHRCALAVYLSGADVETLAQELEAAGYPPDTLVTAAHKLGWPGESIRILPLAELRELSRDKEFSRQTVFLIPPRQDGEEAQSKLYSAGFSHGFRK